MKIEQINYKIRCDIPGCENMASFVLLNKKGFGNVNIHMCNACLKELHSDISKIIVPKSPTNILNKTKKEIV